MEVKVLEEKGNELKLLFKKADTAMVNSLRRAIMNHVPTLAIENVSIYENSSVLFDEFLAHRLALLPLTMDPKSYKKGDKVKLYLKVQGPCIVYSKDIKSADPKIQVVDKNIPIVKLGEGERIRLEAEAVVGIGKEHVKWQPAVVGFQNLPKLEISEECNLCGECIKSCPKGILEEKAKKIVMKDATECILCKNCRDSCSKKALKLDIDKNSFIFYMETHGGLTNRDILKQAVKELKVKVEEFQKSFKEI